MISNRKMNDKSYAVLMSVYAKERPEYLDIAIQSMLDQSVKPSQFVIVKDGKLTVGLETVLNRHVSAQPKLFTVIPLERNVGLGLALAAGLDACEYELIARMDSDDYSQLSRCEKELEIFRQYPYLDAVGCFENEFVDDITNIVSVHQVPETPEEIDRFMHRRCALLHPTVMFKKSAVLSCGGYQHAPLYEDYDLFIRMIRHNSKCYNIQEPLYFIRVGADFFKRRGGLKYMKNLVAFKLKQYQSGFYSLNDFIISAGSQVIVCLLPNFVRDFIYKCFLRNPIKN